MFRPLALLVLLAPAMYVHADCNRTTPERFDQFLETFTNDATFVARRTRFPLTQIIWEYGLDEKGRDTSAQTRSILAKPTGKIGSSLNELGLKTKLLKRSSTRATVEVFVPNSDTIMNYHFRRLGMCWWLVKTEDFSL